MNPFEDLPEDFNQVPRTTFKPFLNDSPFAREGTDLEDLFDDEVTSPVMKKPAEFSPLSKNHLISQNLENNNQQFIFEEEEEQTQGLRRTEISKCDITNLENKIKVLEKQIETVKDRHSEVVSQREAQEKRHQYYFGTVQKEN